MYTKSKSHYNVILTKIKWPHFSFKGYCSSYQAPNLKMTEFCYFAKILYLSGSTEPKTVYNHRNWKSINKCGVFWRFPHSGPSVVVLSNHWYPRKEAWNECISPMHGKNYPVRRWELHVTWSYYNPIWILEFWNAGFILTYCKIHLYRALPSG